MATTSAASGWRGGQEPAATRAVMARVLCWTTAAFLGLFAVIARAASDWIDELPTVTTVAHAVTEQLKIDTADWRFDVRGIALKDDDDLFAVYLVGTLVLLRKIILFKYQEDQSLSPEREAKLRSAVAAYLEAELLIGQAVGTRRGYLPQKCRDIACYRRWFKTGYSNVYISASYRERILPRLFPCDDRAAELDRLAQSYAGRTPFLPSPAETQSIPPEVAGVAPAGCSVYGGDADRNGLCDDWEKPLDDRDAAAVRSGAAGCVLIDLRQVRMADGGGLKVSIASKTADPGSMVRFRVVRSASATTEVNVQPVWEREAQIEGDGSESLPLHAIVARGEKLTPDPDRPFLRVDTVADRSRGPVHCEQPLQVWQQRQRSPRPSGLHGPYGVGNVDAATRRPDDDAVLAPGRGANAAVIATGGIVLALTATSEAGFLVLQDARASGRYYTTPPVPAAPPEDPSARAFVTNGDYASSLLRAFEGSCEEMANFSIAAWVHTHPTLYWGADWSNDNFSMLDFNFAVNMIRVRDIDFGNGLRIRSALEAIYLVYANNVFSERCISSFTPLVPPDRPFDKDEMGAWDERTAFFDSDLYRGYQTRQRRVHCY